MKAINYYKDKDMKDLFIQVDSSSKMVEESKKYSKKNVFKQFRKMPIKLKIFISEGEFTLFWKFCQIYF